MPISLKSDISDFLSEEIMDSLVKGNKNFRLNVVGKSMLPLIKPEDDVIVKLSPDKFVIGDIVVFKRSGQFFIHRILKIKSLKTKTFFLTKGDFAFRFDPLIELNTVLGKVISIEKQGHYLNIETCFRRFFNCLTAHFSFIQGSLYELLRRVKFRVFGSRIFSVFFLGIFAAFSYPVLIVI